jgi:hypothetical protein
MSDKIRNQFIEQWKAAARADDGAWLKRVLEQPDADLDALIESTSAAIGCIEVEDLDPDDPDWDPNFALAWQAYGTDPERKFLATIRLHGDEHAVLFGEYDAFESYDLESLVADRAFDRIVLLMPEAAESDEIADAAAFVEQALGIEVPPYDVTGEMALPWNGSSRRLEVELPRG